MKVLHLFANRLYGAYKSTSAGSPAPQRGSTRDLRAALALSRKKKKKKKEEEEEEEEKKKNKNFPRKQRT